MSCGNGYFGSVAVVGGGAAGMMAAATAARAGVDVTVFERNGASRMGRKLGITGKGRCNLTNDATRDELLENIQRNPRFMYASLAAFMPSDVMRYFEGLGVPLKVERGRRVFPVSDKASDIVFALANEVRDAGCRVVGKRVGAVERTAGGFAVCTEGEKLKFKKVVLCTGGASYPRTGSTGDGYAFARALGHSVTEIKPSLVPIVSDSPICREMQGLSLRNVAVKVVKNGDKTVFEDFGELMFTHFGVTGPTVLSASARLGDVRPGVYELLIDLKPALDEKTLDARLLSDFEKYKNRDFANAMCDLLPQKMIAPFVRISGIAPTLKVNSVTKEQRRRVVSLLKRFAVPLSALGKTDEAIVTSGGVAVGEIDPKTMESKIVEGLYFAGEIIDVDAYTGGYNLQIAWSTAHAAAAAIAKVCAGS